MFCGGEEGAPMSEKEKNWLSESEYNEGLEATFLVSYLKRLLLFRGDEHIHSADSGVVLVCQNIKLYTFNMHNLLHFNCNSAKLS